jgi:DNA-binding MarR family transcriptional regulator
VKLIVRSTIPVSCARNHCYPDQVSASGPGRLSEIEQRAWRGMLGLHSRLLAELDAELEREHGLALSSYELLIKLADSSGRRMRMSELAEQLLLSRSGITRLADRLERQGLIERQRCSEDGRGLFAHLTPAGEAKLAEARPTHLAGVRRHFLDRLSVDEQRDLGALWKRLDGQGAAPELDAVAR